MWWSSAACRWPAALGLFAVAAASVGETATVPNTGRQTQLRHLLLQDCGSCHGMTLRGGLGPALTPEALAEKPAEYLYLTIREGHPGTPMPPWQGILADEEIRWLVEQLHNGVRAP